MSADAAFRLKELTEHPNTEAIIKGRHNTMKIQKFMGEQYNIDQVKRKMQGYAANEQDREKNYSEALKKQVEDTQKVLDTLEKNDREHEFEERAKNYIEAQK